MTESVSRREFVKTVGLGTTALATIGTGALESKSLSAAPKNPIPRWRGFHYHYFATMGRRPAGSGVQAKMPPRPPMTAASLEDDFRIISDFGFDMVRIGVQYWDWVDYTEKTPRGGPLAKDLFKIKESGLTRIDEVIEMARKYKLHVQLDMHRGPGFNFREAVMGEENEPFSLWIDKVAQDAFVFYWDMFAKRYRGISPKELSFDLLNEPARGKNGHAEFGPWVPSLIPSRSVYQKVMTMAVEKIRETSSDRIIFVEGLDKLASADEILPEFIPLGVAQSMHCYAPGEFTHYRSWPDIKKNFLSGPPSWPAKLMDGSTFGRDELEKLHEPWGWLVSQGIGIQCGEFSMATPVGAVPHEIGLRFLTDLLDIMKLHQMGWTYLSFRGGGWGLIDGNDPDVVYEDYHGHKLDRQLLTLLQYH
jgi:endoglucanase